MSCCLVVSSVSCDSLDPSGLVSPGSTVRSLTKDLQHSLDLASATSGDKVVTAQVSGAVDLTAFKELCQSCSVALCLLHFYILFLYFNLFMSL